ncbi:hypothetical protein VD0001_g7138 [Verticillium dahliae]|nr:hypothetical protein VD0001_g7138 [Verticillium dahliae]
MTYSSHYQMPGAFFDSHTTGVHPNVFRPPTTPSASSSIHLGKSTASVGPENASLAAHVKRKRARADTSREQTPLQEWSDANINADGLTDRNCTPAVKVGQPTERYTLAGQLETPGGFHAAGGNGRLDESLYSDSDYRKALGSKRHPVELDSPMNGHPTLLVKPSQQPAGEGWSRFAFNAIGGVMGKVWEFCRGSAFTGFYAGGGTPYAMDGQRPVPASPTKAVTHVEKPRDYFSPENSSAFDGNDANVPGGFPQSDYMPYNPEVLEALTPDSTPSRPAVKRRQVSENDELRRNWIMVDEGSPLEQPRTASRASLRPPSRNSRPSMTTGRRISVPVSRLNTTPSKARRNSLRSPHAVSPAHTAREAPASTASCASVRSPRACSPGPLSPLSPRRIPIPSQQAGRGSNPYSRPSSSAGHYRSNSCVTSPIRPALSHRRTHSGASAASARVQTSRDNDDNVDASPRLSMEAKKLAAKRRKEEQDADLRINDFNYRLKEMIRQGREALGTTFEVDDDAGGWESEH